MRGGEMGWCGSVGVRVVVVAVGVEVGEGIMGLIGFHCLACRTITLLCCYSSHATHSQYTPPSS
jgi:hypothetical protein